MGFLDDITSNLGASAGAGAGSQGLVQSIIEMLGSQPGGLSGLASAFQQNNLGDIVSSWIGKGANLPISAEQVQQVLGNEQISALAEKAGISPDSAGSQLAGLLPDIVDKLTPDGEIPQGGGLMSAGMGLLQNLLNKG